MGPLHQGPLRQCQEDTCDHIAERMQDHSYRVQVLGHALWLRTCLSGRQANGKTCTRAIVDTALNDLLDQHDALYHRMVDDVPPVAELPAHTAQCGGAFHIKGEPQALRPGFQRQCGTRDERAGDQVDP